MELGDTSDLIEDSLLLLDEVAVTDDRFRAVARRLYAFESRYESRPTYFRIMDLLERRGCFETVDLEEHPSYEEHRAALEATSETSVSPVLREPGSEWDEEKNPVVGYRSEGELYVERGGELWRALVDEGRLEGESAQPPEEISLQEAAAEVIEAARDEGATDLILRWFVALGFHFAFHAGDESGEEELLEMLRADAAVSSIRETVREIEDLELKLHHPERNLDVPPKAVRDAHPVLAWWYDPV